MSATLEIPLAKIHEEISGGFMEACIEAGTGSAPADKVVLLRNFLKVLAMRRGQTVTYMPRWSENADSQSSHVHLSLLDASGKPVFHDASDDHSMSETFKLFIGGLQRYLPEMMLCLLYTSPSPRDLSTSRMPSSA